MHGMHAFASLQMNHGASGFAMVITSTCCMEGLLDCDLYIQTLRNQMVVLLSLKSQCFVSLQVMCGAKVQLCCCLVERFCFLGELF